MDWAILRLLMTILLTLVGGFGLMRTMSINVLERTRAVGIMQAIGASTGSVLQILMQEGMMIGAVSWTTGTVLSLPLGKSMSAGVGTLVPSAPATYIFSVSGL
jgi:putative ABC transport system permease protein